MSDQYKNKFADKKATKKWSLKASKSNEQFNNLKLDHRHSLLSMSQDNLDTLTALESSLLHNFVKRGKRIVSIPVDFYHADFKLRAIAKFHGLEYVDDDRDTNIYSRQRQLNPRSTLADYLKAVRRNKPKSNEQ